MFLLMSAGIWVGVCLSCFSMLDISPCINSGRSYVSGICVMGGESWIWIVGGHRCWRVLLFRSWFSLQFAHGSHNGVLVVNPQV